MKALPTDGLPINGFAPNLTFLLKEISATFNIFSLFPFAAREVIIILFEPVAASANEEGTGEVIAVLLIVCPVATSMSFPRENNLFKKGSVFTFAVVVSPANL